MTSPNPDAKVVREQQYDNAVLHDTDGRVIWNALQMDHPVIRRRYDDDTYDVISAKTGRLILARYRLDDPKIPPCQHCGKEPW